MDRLVLAGSLDKAPGFDVVNGANVWTITPDKADEICTIITFPNTAAGGHIRLFSEYGTVRVRVGWNVGNKWYATVVTVTATGVLFSLPENTGALNLYRSSQPGAVGWNLDATIK